MAVPQPRTEQAATRQLTEQPMLKVSSPEPGADPSGTSHMPLHACCSLPVARNAHV